MPPSSSRLLPIALSAAVGALALSSAAHAALPKTATKTIVVGKSVAGVALGMSTAKAARVWKMEAGSSCFEMTPGSAPTCMFEVTSSGANYHTGNISYKGAKRVESIRLRLPNDGERAQFTGPMLKYKTTRKAGRIGLGAKLGKLRSQYGRALKHVYRSPTAHVFQVKGPGKAKTDFTFTAAGASARVVTIELYLGASRY